MNNSQIKLYTSKEILERLFGGIESLSNFIGIKVASVIITKDRVRMFDCSGNEIPKKDDAEWKN